jgi:LytS/YehU family sensor histidine kinase
MRMMLQNSAEKIVSLSQELELLKYYLDLEKLRFNDKFNYKIYIDPKIDAEFCGIPPALMQPYIENAILHGIQHRKDNDGEIQLNFFQMRNDVLVCEVIDNGLGREYSAQMQKLHPHAHTSKGMLITKERLELINKNMEDQLGVEVYDLKDNKGNALGTKIRILINIVEL